MKTMALRGRDLVVSGGDYALVTGSQKAMQDIRGALLEPIGNDRFHPGWGSVLDSYIGKIADETTGFDAQQEVYRVIVNYMAVQQDRAFADQMAGLSAQYSYSELVARVTEVAALLNYDTVAIKIMLENMAGEQISMDEEI